MSTLVVNPGAPVVRGENHSPTIDFGPRQGFLRLARVEIRKAVDTRSGRLLLAAIVGLAVVGLIWHVARSGSTPVGFGGTLDVALIPVQLILPVVGILAMTSEWTQRTALTTFTLSPRRMPVLLAKLCAALVLALGVVVVVVVLSLGATALAGLIGGHGASYAGAGRHIGGGLIANGLNVLMGAAIGLAVMQTAVGVLGYFIAPTAWAILSDQLLHANGRWLDIFTTFDNLSSFDLSGHVPQTLTSLGFWIVLPAAIGLFIANRREVK